MSNNVLRLVTGTLILTFVPLLLAGVAGEQASADRNVLPEEACTAIVQEASKFIRVSLKSRRLDRPFRGSGPKGVIRANALLIALAAQNRMGSQGAEARRLAGLRDAALNLVKAVEKNPRDRAEVLQRAQTLERFGNLQPNPHARLVRYRLKDHFSHDDIGLLFGGCSGGKGHRIQLDLIKFARQATPWTRAERQKLELLAYKVALLGELLRDFDDFSVRSAEQRKTWVRLASAVQDGGWELAKGTRATNFDRAKQALHKVNVACRQCHRQFQ
jgi:hypothetical protein